MRPNKTLRMVCTTGLNYESGRVAIEPGEHCTVETGYHGTRWIYVERNRQQVLAATLYGPKQEKLFRVAFKEAKDVNRSSQTKVRTEVRGRRS